MKRVSTVFLILACLMLTSVSAWGQSTVFVEDFAGFTGTVPITLSFPATGGTTYSLVNTGNGTQVVENSLATSTTPYLKLANPAAGGTSGFMFMYGALSGYSAPFNPTLASNPGIVTWSVNLRHNTNGPLGGTNYFAAVLVSTSSDLTTASGYAILNNSNNYKLVKFIGGITNQTVLVTGLTLGTTSPLYRNYMTLRATYEPSTSTWKLYDRVDGESPATTWSDPSTGTVTLRGSLADTSFLQTTAMTTFGYMSQYLAQATSNNKYLDNFKVSVFKPAATQANTITFSSVGGSSMTVNWNRGDGEKVAVFLKEANGASSQQPSDGTKYTASTFWGSKGTQIGSTGYYCIYNGTGTSVALTGLSAATAYTAEVVEYSGNTDYGVPEVYLTTSVPTASQTTLAAPTIQSSVASLPNFGNVFAGSNSVSATYNVSGSTLSTDITITPPAGFELSTDNVSFSTSPITLTQSGGSVSSTPIYVRFTPTSSGTFSGNITHTSSPATQVDVSVSGTGYQKYYYAGTGDPAVTTNWGVNTDGSGANPADFTSNYQVFEIRNTSSVSTAAAWTVSGTGSKIVVGDPAVGSVTLIVANGFGITGTIDLPAASSGANKLYIEHTAAPTMGTLTAASEVHYQPPVGITTGTNATFGNVFIDGASNGYVNFTGNPVMANLTVAQNDSIRTGDLSSQFIQIQSGGAVTINGTFLTIRTTGFAGTTTGTAGQGIQFLGSENLTLGANSVVQYDRTGSTTQNMDPRSHVNIISGGSAPKALIGATTAAGTLTLKTASGKITLGAHDLTAGSIVGGDNSSYAIATGTGQLKKSVSATGSFTLPVGDANIYSPATIDVTAGSFSSAAFGIKVTNSKHPQNSSTTDYINRYWTVTHTGITGVSYNPTFLFNFSADLPSGNDASLYGGAYNGASWTRMNLAAINADPAYDEFSGTGFSATPLDFTAGEMNAMPVELTSFIVSPQRMKASLLWTTATEMNNYGFEVEKKSGDTWNKIAFVPGNGTTNIEHTYSYVDANVSGKVQYRLKQIDQNGRFVYTTAVEAVVTLTAEDYALSGNFPNPFNPSTKFSFAFRSSEHATVTVYNVIGQQVAVLFNDVAAANQLYTMTFDARNLPSGIYFYALHSASRNEVKKMLLVK
jgi:hypothetical protein